MNNIKISSDPALLDREFIVGALQTTYWASDRPRETILASIDRSLCFGLYLDSPKQQIGFARVVTDEATFSWLCDVFVVPAYRGQGLGKRLVAAVVTDPRLVSTAIFLGTKDAHRLYEKFGFVRWALMRRPADTPQAKSAPAS